MKSSIPKHSPDSNKIVNIQGIKAPDVSEKLTVVDQYLREGCTVLALKVGSKKPDASFSKSRGTWATATSIGDVERWLARKPMLNIGKILPLNRIVLDIDVKNGSKGVASLATLEASLGPLPATRKTTTPSGGWHLEFTLPEDTGIRGGNGVSPGIDTRCGSEFYLASPPSIVDGVAYSCQDYCDCAELPAAWVTYLQTHTRETKAPSAAGEKSSDWLAKKNEAFAKEYPLHISPISAYVTYMSVREIALASRLWVEDTTNASDRLIRAGSTSEAGFRIKVTSENVGLATDFHGVLTPQGAPYYMNAFQLRKYIILHEDIDPLTDEKILGITEEEAFAQVMDEARALIPSDYIDTPDAHIGLTVGEINELASRANVHADDLKDFAWFKEKAAEQTTETSGAFIKELAGYAAGEVFTAIEIGILIDILVDGKVGRRADIKKMLRTTEKAIVVAEKAQAKEAIRSTVPPSLTANGLLRYPIWHDMRGDMSLDTIPNAKALLSAMGLTPRLNLMKREDEFTDIAGKTYAYGIMHPRLKSAAEVLDHKNKFMIDYTQVIADENQYHPVREWLDGVKWDGVDRLPELISKLHGDTSEEMKLLGFKRWAVGAIQGVMLDTPKPQQFVLVLQGPQGIGKTTFFSDLVGNIPGAFKGGVQLDPHKVDSVRNATSQWITELGEVEGTLRRDLPSIKAFVTADSDTWRAPFAISSRTYPRRTAYVASVNDASYLQDPTGNRRWFSINVEYMDFIGDFNSQQFWAQMWELAQAGERMNFVKEELEQLEIINEAFMKEDPVYDTLLDEFGKNFVGEKTALAWRDLGYENKSASEIWAKHCVGRKPTALEAQAVGRAMGRLGYKRTQYKPPGTNSPRYGYWVSCKDDPFDDEEIDLLS